MPRYARLTCFVLVGAACYVVQLLLFESMLFAHVHAFLAGYCAFSASAQVNFVLSKYLTWRDRPTESRSHLAQRWISFNVLVVLLAAINSGIVLSLSTMVWNWLSVAIAIAVTTAGSLYVNQAFVFRGKHERAQPQAA